MPAIAAMASSSRPANEVLVGGAFHDLIEGRETLVSGDHRPIDYQ